MPPDSELIRAPTPEEQQRMANLAKLAFDNESGRNIVVYIEFFPDQYVLYPGETLNIYYEPDDSGEGLHVNVHENGDLQVHLWNFETTIVTTDGKIVPPWTREADVRTSRSSNGV